MCRAECTKGPGAVMGISNIPGREVTHIGDNAEMENMDKSWTVRIAILDQISDRTLTEV